MRFVTREEIEEIDRRAQAEFGIPAETLMENAGAAAAREVLARTSGPVVVVCGRGNNGGDGFVAARHLHEAGRFVRVHILSVPEADTPAGRNFEKVRRLCGEFSKGAIVDAIFGTGLRRPVEGKYRAAIEEINRRKEFVLAVDVPSGLDANSGRPLGAAVEAAVTVTMGLPKVGFRGAERYTGEVVVAEIGYPAALTETGR
ncbi:MAG: NAD(P)H-hydrate epimerase [Planctomycetes bacterium]|nr:NAD(P)H-hydrate epimerase [Planctomycetota bacterium]